MIILGNTVILGDGHGDPRHKIDGRGDSKCYGDGRGDSQRHGVHFSVLD
mgnify:CR=1 FL=1